MFRDIDLSIFLPALALTVIGIILIFAATYYSAIPSEKSLYAKQIFWTLLALAACFVVFKIPLKFHLALAPFYYGLSLFVLLALMIYSKEFASRWIRVGGFNIQPAEPAKLALVLMIARFLAFKKMRFQNYGWVFTMLLIAAVPAALVLIQPDLGSSLVFFALYLFMLVWTGLPINRVLLVITPILSMLCAFHWITWAIFFFLLFLLIIFSRLTIVQTVFFIIVNLLFGMVTPLIWNKLHGYQKLRIITFLDPGQDPRGAGYQIIQSKIAVGSGGFFGQGFLEGSQTKLNFLPEQHTDFIFSVLAEQFGFIGCIVVIGLFLWIFYKGLTVAYKARNPFYSYIVAGVVGILVFQVLLNIGMAIGLMPVTGLPLPLVSYGGSSLIFFWTAVGFILAVRRDWHEY